jgi:hypothetical protein
MLRRNSGSVRSALIVAVLSLLGVTACGGTSDDNVDAATRPDTGTSDGGRDASEASDASDDATSGASDSGARDATADTYTFAP